MNDDPIAEMGKAEDNAKIPRPDSPRPEPDEPVGDNPFEAEERRIAEEND